MAYQLLTADEQDDMLAATLLAQERDHFAHTINQQRYEAIMATLPDTHPFHKRVGELRIETLARLEEVNAIIAALTPQLPAKPRLNAALGRLKAGGAV